MSLSFRTDGDFINLVNIDDTSIQVETTIKRVHKTSRSIGWTLEDDVARISFSIDGISFNNILVTDIDFDGTPMDSQDDFETGVAAMFPAYDTSSQGDSSYTVYTALFSQPNSATDNPTATVLANTLGGAVVWARDSAGNYSGTLVDAFTEDKTHFAPFGNFGGDANTYLPIWDGSGSIIGYWTMYWSNEDAIGLQVKAADGSAADLFDLIGSTDLMLPDIRVYE